MATQNPLLAPGTWVQINQTSQSPLAPGPSNDEQGIGKVLQSFTQEDGPYYQVVWNPGSMQPKTALYHCDDLTPITQDQATQIICQMNAGTYTPASQGNLGSNYQPPPTESGSEQPPYG